MENSLAHGNRYSELVLSIPGLSLDAGRHVDASRALYVTNADSADAPDRLWRAVVKVNYDWYRAPDGALVAPYPMPPFQYKDEERLERRAAALRIFERTIGLLVSGNADPAQYSAGPLIDAFHLLPHASIVKWLKENVPRERFVNLPPPTRAGAVKKGGLRRVCPRGVTRRRRHREQGRGTGGLAHLRQGPGNGPCPLVNYGHLMRPSLTDAEAPFVFHGTSSRRAWSAR